MEIASKLLHAEGNAILHSKVRLALLDALGNDALRMEIDVDDGNVSLAGKVAGGGSRKLAGEVARKLPGVKSVKDDLRVATESFDDTGPPGKAGKEVADRKLEAKVQMKLLEEIGATALKVGVDAADGVVTLSGRPCDRDLLAAAERTASSVGGVKLWVIHEAFGAEHVNAQPLAIVDAGGVARDSGGASLPRGMSAERPSAPAMRASTNTRGFTQ